MDGHRQCVAFAFAMYDYLYNDKKRSMWGHPLVNARLLKGAFVTFFQDLRRDEKKFFNYFRMSVVSFDELEANLNDTIKNKDTRCRLSIPPIEMLAVTLRCLTIFRVTQKYLQTLNYLLTDRTAAIGQRTMTSHTPETTINIINMDQLDQEVLKMIADTLNDTIQCPVCLGTLRPPVSQCSSGHALCPDCKPQIDICPTCRKDFIETKPIVLQQLLEQLPRACLFRTLGCPEVYIPGGTHEILCSYRTVDCKLLECEWSGQAKKLQSHLTVSHQDVTVVLLDETVSELVWKNFNNTEDSFKYIPFVAYNQVFWEYIHMNVEVQKLCISFTRLGNGHASFKYFAIISFKNNNIGYTYTIKVPVDNNQFIDFYEEHCMTVPGNMLPRFITLDSSLVYSVQIIKEDD